MKRICYLQAGPGGGGGVSGLICCDSDHDGMNEIIFSCTYPPPNHITRWEIWEYRPNNNYELVFADTGVYPYPPGITTGNFRPFDDGDIDNDCLTDLVGPNAERITNPDSTYYIADNQESPNYNYYPSSLSWSIRCSNFGFGTTFYFTSDLDRDSRKELLTYEGFSDDTTRLMLVENIANNQNIPVWRRFTYGASFAFGDFDIDSFSDFVTANPGSSGQVYFFENIGDNQYERITIDTVHLPNGTDVFSGNDIDGDGKPEFFIAFYVVSGAEYLYMWEATSNNNFERILVAQANGGAYRSSKCGDIDGDGIEEIVWSVTSQVLIYKASANNQFQLIWTDSNTPGTSERINIFDMNKNGYNEIVVGGSGKTSIFEVEAVRLLRPNGGEVFQDSTQELIRWQKFYPPRCDSLSLFYSIDNGRTYQLIANSIEPTETSYVWTVPSVNSDSCKIKIIAYGPGWQYDETDGLFSITSTNIEEIATLPLVKTLNMRAFPNPAKSVIRVRYSLPVEGKVSLQLFDISGRLVTTLVNETKKPGNYSVTINSSTHNAVTLSSGVYFLSLQTESKRIIKSVTIIK